MSEDEEEGFGLSPERGTAAASFKPSKVAEETASSAAASSAAASSESPIPSVTFSKEHNKRLLRTFKHVVRHNDIVLLSTHGSNNLLTKQPLFVVPKNVYVLERARLGEITTTCGDETLHDVLQDREELLRQLIATHHYSTRRTTITKSVKKEALFNSSSFNVYFPGDYMFNRQLTTDSKTDPYWGVYKFKPSGRPEQMSSKHVDSKQLSEIFHSGKLFSITTPIVIVINSCANLDDATLDILFMKNKGISDPKGSTILLCNTIKGILNLQQFQRQKFMKMIGQKKNTLIKLKEVGYHGSVQYTFEERDDVINYVSMFLDLLEEIKQIQRLSNSMTNPTEIAILQAKKGRFEKLRDYFKEYLQNTYIKNPVSSGEISLYKYGKDLDPETEGYSYAPHDFAVLYYFMKRNDCSLLPEFINVLKDLGIVSGGGKRRRRNVTRRRLKK